MLWQWYNPSTRSSHSPRRSKTLIYFPCRQQSPHCAINNIYSSHIILALRKYEQIPVSVACCFLLPGCLLSLLIYLLGQLTKYLFICFIHKFRVKYNKWGIFRSSFISMLMQTWQLMNDRLFQNIQKVMYKETSRSLSSLRCIMLFISKLNLINRVNNMFVFSDIFPYVHVNN